MNIKIRNIALSIFIYFSTYLQAQNLVLNGSFELNNGCPEGYNLSKTNEWKNGPIGWLSPTSGTPDYYNTCSKNERCRLQKPKSGNGYTGIYVYSPIEGGYGPEYIYTTLDSALKENESYLIKFYISLMDNSHYVCSYLSAYLSEKCPAIKDFYKFLPYVPQISNTDKFLSNDSEWVEISGIYSATGGEKFITIGNFISIQNLGGKSREVPHKLASSLESIAYYFIDDVSVTNITNEFDYVIENKPIQLKNIFFEKGKSNLLVSSFPELDKLAASLKQNSKSLEVSGHTDNSGKENENLKLSEARAKAVVNYLISKGITKERLKFKGYGSSKPIAKNDTEEGKQQNRRVEIEFIK